MRAVFHSLRIAEVEPLTSESVAITFEVPPDLESDYRFLPGQHVTVRTPLAGDDARRNYSLTSVDALRIGVKLIPGGGFSSYALSRLKVGDVVDVMTPTGRFCTEPDPDRDRRVVCIAAGSGIAPILSIIHGILDVEEKSRVTLLYGNRSSGTVMFLEELADLQDRYLDRFQLFHVLSREQSAVDLFSGRIDGPKLERFLSTLIPAGEVDDWYVCGPYAMITELRSALRTHGVDRERVHSELFHVGATTTAGAPASSQQASDPQASSQQASDRQASSEQASNPPQPDAADDDCAVTAMLDGRQSTFRLARKGVPVLEGMLGVRSDAPFACRGGVCGTCRAKVLEGAVTMDQCYALEPSDIAKGYVLTCQSHPTTDQLVVDYDI